MLGGLLALLSAATFAFNNASARRGVLTGTVFQALSITVPIGVPLFLIITLAAGYIGAVFEFSQNALLLLMAAGIVHFVGGRYCNYRATKAMGANLAGLVQQGETIVALVLAIILLGEYLTPLRVIGITLVLLGPALTLRSEARRASIAAKAAAAAGAAVTPPSEIGSAKPKFQPKLVEGYTFGALACLGYGLSFVLVRAALENVGAGASLAGGLISYIAAAIFIGIVIIATGQVSHVAAMDRTAMKWFTLAGVLVCLSQVFRYMALALAPVSVVAPIQRLSSLFRLYFNWIFNREHEVFDEKVIVATVLSLIGAVALSISTDTVLQFVQLPDFLVTIARLRWP